MFKTNHVAVPILLAALSLVACTHSERESTSNVASAASKKAPRMVKTCTQTACDQRHDDDASACSQCLEACTESMMYGYDCDPSLDCHYSCATTECSDDDKKECLESGWKLEEALKKDDDVERDCLAQVNDLQSCSGETFVEVSAFCEHFAKFEPAGDVSLNACLTGLACGESPMSCPSGKSTFGDDLCSQVQGCGDVCDDKMRSALNAIGAWVRPEVLEAGKGCAKESCDDVGACLGAFVEAVTF